MKGFSRCMGNTTSVMAEFYALRDGLQLASQMGISCLEVELDAKIVVNLVLSNSMPNRAYSTLLNYCRFQQVKVTHIFLKTNRCTDAMVMRGCLQQECFVLFNDPPSANISSFVVFVANDMYYVRCYANSMPFLAS